MLTSCDDEVPVPSYLTIEAINLLTQSGQGSNSHRTSYGWIFVDDDFYGGYPLPVTFPIVGDGLKNVKIDFGVEYEDSFNLFIQFVK